MKLSQFNLSEYLLLSVPIERKKPSKNMIETDSQRPNIAFFSIILHKNFRCNVIRGPYCIHLLLFLVKGNCKSEINQFYFIFLTKHNVLRFDVSMNNILRMTMLQCFEKLEHISSTYFFIKIILRFLKLMQKLSSFTQFHT